MTTTCTDSTFVHWRLGNVKCYRRSLTISSDHYGRPWIDIPWALELNSMFRSSSHLGPQQNQSPPLKNRFVESPGVAAESLRVAVESTSSSLYNSLQVAEESHSRYTISSSTLSNTNSHPASVRMRWKKLWRRENGKILWPISEHKSNWIGNGYRTETNRSSRF